MLHDESINDDSHLPPLELIRELFSSIRDVNRRIDELKGLLRSGYVSKDKEAEVVNRCKALIETRMRLMYSVYDVRHKFVEALSDEHNKVEIDKKFGIRKLYDLLKVL
jgi:hypothetical protein